MSRELLSTLHQLVAELHADAAVVWREEEGLSEGLVLASVPPALVAAGSPWPPGGPRAPTLRVQRSPSMISLLVPTAVRLSLHAPPRAVLSTPLSLTGGSLLVLWCTADPDDAHVVPVLTASLERLGRQATDWADHQQCQATALRVGAALGALTQAVVTIDELRDVANLNAAAARLLGLTEGDVRSSSVATALRALQDRALNQDEVRRVAAQLRATPLAETEESTWVFPRAPTHLRVHSAPIQQQGLSGRTWVFDDVSALMTALRDAEQARAAFEASERQYRLLAENASDVVFRLTGDGRLAWLSPSITTLMGWTPEELEGSPFIDFVHPDDHPLVSGGRPHPGNLEVRVRTREGTWRWVSVKFRSLRAPDGTLLSRVGGWRDIQTEVETREALRTARDTADAANRAKSDFLSSMSHEIRTPMNGIIGAAQLISDTALSAEQREYLDIITGSSDNLLSLINDVLDLSKIESGKLELEDKSFSLRRTIADVVRAHATVWKQKGLHVTTEFVDDVPDQLRGDPLRIKQILLNFLGNAIKFTPHGSITLTASVAQRRGSIAELVLAVKDSGIGISPAGLRKLFQPFVQADASISRRFGGTGLGLSICTRLVGLMKGQIWAESEEGRGSTFFVRLPLQVEEVAPEADTTQHALPRQPRGRALRVLLVDDVKTNLFLATRILERAGHSVVTAENGSEAVQAVKREHFDVVLMDVQMPVMDGLEATREIREWERHRAWRVPIMALTARAMENEREEILSQGFDAYLPKPIVVSSLMQELERCVGAKQAA